MIENENAAVDVDAVLADLKVPYAIIGGMAVQHWGEARYTKDVDLTVLVPIENEEDFLRKLETRLPPRRDGAIEFALRHRIYIAQTAAGFPVDISLGVPGYEEQMLANAIDYVTQAGKTVRLCSAEDLIIHKSVAGRPQDVRDIEGIIIRQGGKLDRGYIRYWLRIFSDLLETDDVIDRFEQAWRKYGSRESS